VDVKACVQATKKAAGTIIRLTSCKDVWAALRVLAPAGAKHIDDVSGYEYRVQPVDRVDRADAAIHSGKGKDRLGSAIHALAFFEDKGSLQRVNCRDGGTEELGSVHESLLELHPVVQVATPPWTFAFAGDEAGGTVKGCSRRSETDPVAG